MSYDPGQLSSEIARLDALTDDLDPSGDSTFATVTATTVAAGSVTASGVVSSDFNQQSVDVALTAIGTDRAGSLALTAHLNIVTGGATGTGVELPDLSGSPGADVVVFNANSSAIKVYAAGSQTIDGNAGSSGVTLTNAKRCVYFMTSTTAWVSAQLGVVSA